MFWQSAEQLAAPSDEDSLESDDPLSRVRVHTHTHIHTHI